MCMSGRKERREGRVEEGGTVTEYEIGRGEGGLCTYAMEGGCGREGSSGVEAQRSEGNLCNRIARECRKQLTLCPALPLELPRLCVVSVLSTWLQPRPARSGDRGELPCPNTAAVHEEFKTKACFLWRGAHSSAYRGVCVCVRACVHVCVGTCRMLCVVGATAVLYLSTLPSACCVHRKEACSLVGVASTDSLVTATVSTPVVCE